MIFNSKQFCLKYFPHHFSSLNLLLKVSFTARHFFVCVLMPSTFGYFKKKNFFYSRERKLEINLFSFCPIDHFVHYLQTNQAIRHCSIWVKFIFTRQTYFDFLSLIIHVKSFFYKKNSKYFNLKKRKLNKVEEKFIKKIKKSSSDIFFWAQIGKLWLSFFGRCWSLFHNRLLLRLEWQLPISINNVSSEIDLNFFQKKSLLYSFFYI